MILFDPGRHGPDLSAYLDGELDARRAAEIERLLAESPEARIYLDQLRAVANGLRALPRLSAPDALRAALRTRSATAPGTGARGRSWIIALRTGAIAAALGIAWIAGQSFIGPATAPQLGALRRDEPLVAARETDEESDKKLKDQPTVALGIPAANERESNETPTAAPAPAPAAGDLASASAARTRAVVGERPAEGFDAARAPGDSGRAGGAGGGAVAEGLEDLPAGEFDVVVNTRTPDEFKAVNDLLISLQAPPAETKTAYVARVEEADGGETHQLQLPAAEIGLLVAQLEDRSQQNVLVQRRADAGSDQAYKSAAAGDDEVRRAVEAADKPVGGGADGGGQKREQLRKESPPQRPAAKKPAGGRDPETEGAARQSSAPSTPTTRVSQPDGRTERGARQRLLDQTTRNAGRGGRLVYRAPLNRQVTEQRGAAIQGSASQPGDADDTVVVNVLVAPPAAQSQPASRSVP